MNEKCKKYDDMSDVFEYGNISDDEIVKLCNQILLESKDEDPLVQVQSFTKDKHGSHQRHDWLRRFDRPGNGQR